MSVKVFFSAAKTLKSARKKSNSTRKNSQNCTREPIFPTREKNQKSGREKSQKTSKLKFLANRFILLLCRAIAKPRRGGLAIIGIE